MAEPMRWHPSKDSAEPRRAKFLSETEDPRCFAPKIDKEAPKREKYRKDMELPRFAQSMIDKENIDPSLVKPNTDTVDPNRV